MCIRDSFAVIIDYAVGNLLGIDDLHIIANLAPIRHLVVDVSLDELADFLLHFLVREMLHHEGCELAVQIADCLLYTSILLSFSAAKLNVFCDIWIE